MTDTTNVVIKVDSSQARAANKDVAALQKSVIGLTADLKKMTAASTAMNAASTTYIKKTVDAGATASLGQATSKDTGVSRLKPKARSARSAKAPLSWWTKPSSISSRMSTRASKVSPRRWLRASSSYWPKC
jgi:hypothetical protein